MITLQVTQYKNTDYVIRATGITNIFLEANPMGSKL